MSHLTTVLRLTGRDTLDLLHRISTQSLTDLAVGEARATLFCDFRARLLHRAIVARLPDDAIWLLRDDAPGGPLAAHLDKHIFREDVQVEDLADRLAVVGRLRVQLAPAQVGSDGSPAMVGIAPDAAFELVLATAPPLSPTDAHAWELARIEAGRPRHGHEISDSFHPYEVGLSDEVHLSKGCYTGQEVLQRLITYDSVRRRLVRVGGAGAVPSVPVALCAGEERVGTLTSAIATANESWVGLGVLSAIAVTSNATVTVEDRPEPASITAFPQRRPLGLPGATPR